MRRAATIVIVSSLLVALAPASPVAAATVIKLATLVPQGTPWDYGLRQMGDEWASCTEGRVVLRIYPGGVAGDEPDVMRKLRIGQLQAAAVTVGALASADEAFRVFQIPMLYASYGELQAVTARLEPELESRLEAKGLVLLAWGHGGWVHLFSKRQIRTVEELEQTKLFAWAGDNRMVEWFKRNGFRVVPLAATDIVTALQTGMVEAVPTTPLAALYAGWYERVPHMLDLGFAPLVGGIVVTRRAWEGLAEADRACMRAAADRVEARLSEAIPRQDREAIAEMRERGLQVTELSAAERQGWQAAAAEFADAMRNEMIPPEVLDVALATQAEFRRQGDE